MELMVNGEAIHCSTTQLDTASPTLAQRVKIASLAGEVLDIKVEPEATDAIVHFIKTGLFQTDFEKLSDVTYEAYRLDMPALLHRCEEEYLDQLMPTNCLESLLFAEGNGCERLAEQAFSIAVAHFEEISNTEQFLYIGKTHLKKLVLKANLSVCTLQSVYDAIVRWYGYESNVRSTDTVDIVRAFSRRMSWEKPKMGKVLSTNFDDNISKEHRPNLAKKTELFSEPTVALANKAKCVDVICIGYTSSEELSVIYLSLDAGKPSITAKPIPKSENLGSDTAFCHTADAIYACGGDEKSEGARRFDIYTQTWNKCPKMFRGRKYHMVCMVNDRMYVLGGVSTNTEKIFEYVDKYNLSTKHWTDAGKLDGFVRSAVCAAYGEDIYVFGGLNSQSRTYQTIQCYDTAAKKTTNVCKLPTKSLICQAVAEGNMIYLIAANGEVMQFDPQREELKNLPNCSNAGKGCGAFIQDGFLYVFGGKTGRRHQRSSSDIHRLDLGNLGSHWQFVSSLPQKISVLACSKAFLDVK